ncbi:SCO family protein [Lysobacter sp. S4-A87]|uniref:SCO family protein n=1 Tax=Lysobacter sp. S4-A87 TaxID=2925843 RepID=UPI001F53DD27|nr:SCO family protein [Lysobacter sp. S4-A87]UNK49417.1 SCO family protein [Lysobacter sp. S4-A87]
MRPALGGRVLSVVAGLLSSMSSLATANELPGDSVYQAAAALTDQNGRSLAWQDLRGRPVVVSMFYSNCHLMCPLIIGSGKALQSQLSASDRDALDLAVLSIDPARDTPAALRAVAEAHHLDPRWRLLRPLDADVRTLAAVLDIRYRAQPDGTFNHTSTLILLDRDGRILARSGVTDLQPDPEFVAEVKKYLAASP